MDYIIMDMSYNDFLMQSTEKFLNDLINCPIIIGTVRHKPTPKSRPTQIDNPLHHKSRFQAIELL